MDRARHREAVLTQTSRAEAADGTAYCYAFRAMGGQHELQLWAHDRLVADRAAHTAIGDVLRIEAKYSRYREDSVTAAINRAAGGAAVAIDQETAALLRFGERCHALSGGRFDLTSGVLRRAWDFRRQPPRLPGAAEIAAAHAKVGWARVEWSDRSVRLRDAGMELDFGGIGKEYAADRVAAICMDHGIRHGFVNLGGDVRVIGTQVDGTPWRVGLRHPRRARALIGEVELCDAAVATSGDYERYFELDGRRYCHLLDARTARPVDHFQSASVVAPLATLAGSYATIAMLLGEAAVPFLRAQHADYLLVAADGTVSCGGAAFERATNE
jgi:FAD:protein FMN transferase